VLAPSCSDSQPTPSAPPTVRRPDPLFGKAAGFNVWVVTFDTVRADAIGCYGDPRAKTPNVDRLASRGARYTRAIAPAPTTLPSHSTLFTGLDPLTHGVHNNGTFRLGDERTTLAERLAAQGYHTAAVIGAFVLESRFGLAQGFESYQDELHQDGAAEGAAHFVERKASTVTDHALAWLAQRDERPFFLWTHFFDAHLPYVAPEEYLKGQPRRDVNGPWDAEANRREYLAEVAYADRELGRLLEALGPETLARTLVVFTSDHGEGLGEHGEYTHSRLIYEGSLRVPLVISCPALFEKPLVVSDRIAGLVDVVPTVLSLLGLPEPVGLDGVALFRTDLDPARAIYSESLVTLFNHGWAPLYGYTRLTDKFIQAPRPEYYDLRADAGERRNLFSATQPAAQDLSRKLRTRLASVKPIERSAEAALSREDEAWLAQLGYSRSSVPVDSGKLDPKDMIVTWAVLTNASGMVERGEIEAALAEVQRVLDRNPVDPFAWEVAYTAHWKRKDLPRAEEALLKVLELNPSADAFVRLATVLMEQNRTEECLALLDRASSSLPDNGEVALSRAACFARMARYPQARAEFERALRIDPVRASARATESLAELAREGH
jgi:arylsulfatase A-like enzyme